MRVSDLGQACHNERVFNRLQSMLLAPNKLATSEVSTARTLFHICEAEDAIGNAKSYPPPIRTTYAEPDSLLVTLSAVIPNSTRQHNTRRNWLTIVS